MGVARVPGHDIDAPPAPEADFVSSTRIFYDAIAEDYAEMFAGKHTANPLDRALLAGFAELVTRGGGGEVADLGCGPGRVTAYLASLGLSVFGLDLSDPMLTIARRENPGLRFRQGSMLELDIPDGSWRRRSPGTRPSTHLWTNSRPCSGSSTASWHPAPTCSLPSRPATDPSP